MRNLGIMLPRRTNGRNPFDGLAAGFMPESYDPVALQQLSYYGYGLPTTAQSMHMSHQSIV